MLKCKTCGGEYEPLLADGLRYYHVCPPAALVTVERLGVKTEIPIGELAPLDKEISRRYVPRENARDENVKIGADGKADGIVSEGLGVEKLVDRAKA